MVFQIANDMHADVILTTRIKIENSHITLSCESEGTRFTVYFT